MTAELPDPIAVQAALTEADRIGREQASAQALANWHAHGEFERGYQQCLTDQQREAAETARQLAADVDLMELRWGPGGRENFGAPRTGDFRGNGRAFYPPGRRPAVHRPHRQTEPDIEREAG